MSVKTTEVVHNAQASDARYALERTFSHMLDGLLDVVTTIPESVLQHTKPDTDGMSMQAVGLPKDETRSPEQAAEAKAAMANAFPIPSVGEVDVFAKVIAGCLEHKDPKLRRQIKRMLARADKESNTPYPTDKSMPQPVVAVLKKEQVKRAKRKRK